MPVQIIETANVVVVQDNIVKVLQVGIPGPAGIQGPAGPSAAELLIGLDSAKPTTGFTGNRFYFATDTLFLYVDTGTVWVKPVGVLG